VRAAMSSIGTGYDLSSTTYSPDGKVFQIEYATKAVDNSGCACCCPGRLTTSLLRATQHYLWAVHTRHKDTDPLSPLASSLVHSTAVGIRCADGVVLVRTHPVAGPWQHRRSGPCV